MKTTSGAARVFAVLLVLLCAGRPARGQTVPTDTVATDSLRHGPVHNPLLLPIVVAVFGTMMAAPASFVLAPESDTVPATLRDHAWLFATAGYAQTPAVGGEGKETRRGWAHSYSVEFLRGAVYGELRGEEHSVPDGLRLRSARIGYMLRRRARAGGVTLGYRSAEGGALPAGVEVGFPLILESDDGWMRMNAAYVVARGRGSWSWRFHGGAHIRGTRLSPGFSTDLKVPLWGGGASVVNLAALVGVRL